MKTFKDAIALIMAEPPEPHYPAYFADLLREADVPDKDVGKCSEIPNGSDTISRQAAIDAPSEAGLINYAATGDGNGMIQAVNVIKGLPSAEPRERLVAKIDVSEEQIRDALEKIRNEPVHLIPSAEPAWIPVREPAWIPCSERMPEKVGVYLVTDHKGDVARYVFFDSETSKDYWKRCVTAWMPIPEPWKGEKHETD